MNTLVGGGDSHPDHNDAMTQETTVQTAALGAEVSAGGPRLNLIPREGGNTFSGATYVGYTDSGFQSNNLGDLLSRGLQTPDAVAKIYDVNASIGGPIKRDRLWFFGSYATSETTTLSPTASTRTAAPVYTTSVCATTRCG